MERKLPEQTNRLKPSSNTSSKTPRALAVEGQQYPLIGDTEKVYDRHIRKALAQVYVIIGLHPDYFPKDEVDQLLVSYIREHMADLSLRDVLNAFILGVQKKLQVKDRRGNLQPIDVDPRFNFSIRFLEDVMTAYREYRKPFLRQQQEIKQITKKAAWTKENSIDTYVEQYKRHLEGKNIIDFGNVIFKVLRDDIGFVRATDRDIEDKATEMIAEGKDTDEMSLDEFAQKLTSRGKKTRMSTTISKVKTGLVSQFFNELKEQEISTEDFREMLKEKLL